MDAATIGAVRELSARYAAAVDDRDASTVTGLFHPDGRLVLPDPGDLQVERDHVGPDAIAAALRPAFALVATVHLVGSIVVDRLPPDEHREVDADPQPAPVFSPRLTGRVTCVAHHFSADPDAATFRDLVWYLHYDDVYRTNPAGQWCFARRQLVLDAVTTGRAHHVRFR